MGNVALCAPSLISSTSGTHVIKILSSTDGRILMINSTSSQPLIKAAEIMVENPGQFVCESSQLKVGQRIAGLTAEEELERGELYFLLPMEMLYSVLTSEEMKCLTDKTSKLLMKSSNINFSKIFPEFNCLFPNNNNNNNNSNSEGGGEDSVSETTLSERRYSRQRSWQPALETIIETPPRL